MKRFYFHPLFPPSSSLPFSFLPSLFLSFRVSGTQNVGGVLLPNFFALIFYSPSFKPFFRFPPQTNNDSSFSPPSLHSPFVCFFSLSSSLFLLLSFFSFFISQFCCFFLFLMWGIFSILDPFVEYYFSIFLLKISFFQKLCFSHSINQNI